MRMTTYALIGANLLVVTMAHADPNRYIFAGDQSLGNWDIVRMNDDGTNMVRLTSSSANEFGFDVSPDGLHMAFNSNATGTHQVYVMDLATGSAHQVTSTGQNMFPRWSHDGGRLLVSSALSPGSADDLVTVNADGSDLHFLTNSGLNETQGEWSPDGSKIVFSKGMPNGS